MESVLVGVIVPKVQRHDLPILVPVPFLQVQLPEQKTQRFPFIPIHPGLDLEHLAALRFLQALSVARDLPVHHVLHRAPPLGLAVAVVHADAELVVLHVRARYVLHRTFAFPVHRVHHRRGPRRRLVQLHVIRLVLRLRADDVQAVRSRVVQLRKLDEVVHLLAAAA